VVYRRLKVTLVIKLLIVLITHFLLLHEWTGLLEKAGTYSSEILHDTTAHNVNSFNVTSQPNYSHTRLVDVLLALHTLHIPCLARITDQFDLKEKQPCINAINHTHYTCPE